LLKEGATVFVKKLESSKNNRFGGNELPLKHEFAGRVFRGLEEG